ncbi:MAG TPA: hypothetical protein VLV31_06090, partial [Candidatus Acidoferrales bacterium]|nr:hypothetical protein [Candidatus Acidoferrales bacterium]
TACAGNNGCAPSVGDFAQAVLTVKSSGSTLVLSATNSTEESTVTFIGSGLSPSDTSCTLNSYNYELHTAIPDGNLLTSPTCSISTPGIATGSFVVSPYATTNINWTLRVMGSPAQDFTSYAAFNVTADVIVTPTSGTIHTVFTFTGSGFSSAATTCNATIVPPFPSGSKAGCYMSANTGQVSGSVVVPTGTTPGTYAIYVTDNTGKVAAGVFTVGTPSALVVLNPATVSQGQAVGVAGFGFNPNDTYCTISAVGNPGLFGTPTASNPTCIISGGYVSGAFTVSNTAPGGYYLISVRACSVAPTLNVCPAGDGLDFASNFLGVTLATTVTTFSTTSTTDTTTTSVSTTTTSIATSFSYSSTTVSTTGILFTTYTHYTASTVSGQTTTTQVQSTSTTQTQTTVTLSTTTQFTTVGCGPLPCGFVVKPQPMNAAAGVDSTGLLAALLLLVPMLLRRLFT